MSDATGERAAHARLFAGLLGDAGTATPAEVASRTGVSPEAAAETLSALEREGLLERMTPGAYRAARLDSRELRELYPVVLLLEATAIRDAPGMEPAALAELRAANERLRATEDAGEASRADDEFHRRLTAGCGNEQLLAVLDPVRRALLSYERVYMDSAERRARSVAQHDAIVAALERGDQAGAAALVRENFTSALPELTRALDARRPAP
jgi:DNA-binding GntR family transcriptional regulator